MLERLGNVIYWIGCIAAFLFVIAGLFGSFAGGEVTVSLLAFAGGFICWLIGRAAKYILKEP